MRRKDKDPILSEKPSFFQGMQDTISPLKSPVQLCFVGSTHGRLSGEACSVLDRLCVPPQGSISPGPCDFSGGEALQQQWELSHWARAGQLHHEPRTASPVTVPQAPVTGVAVRGLVQESGVHGEDCPGSQLPVAPSKRQLKLWPLLAWQKAAWEPLLQGP